MRPRVDDSEVMHVPAGDDLLGVAGDRCGRLFVVERRGPLAWVGLAVVLLLGVAPACGDDDVVALGDLRCRTGGSRSTAIEQQAPLLTPGDVFRMAREHDPLLPSDGWEVERTGPGGQRWLQRDGDLVTAVVGMSEYDAGWWIDGVSACAE